MATTNVKNKNNNNQVDPEIYDARIYIEKDIQTFSRAYYLCNDENKDVFKSLLRSRERELEQLNEIEKVKEEITNVVKY